MSQVYIAVGLVLTLIFTVSCSNSESIQSKIESQPETSEMYNAISIAIDKYAEVQESQNEFKLVSAQQIIVNGKHIWRITFKPVSLLPDDPSTQEIGAGGEIFVNVDLKTEEVIVTYGE